jgi:hypothetical protein
LLRETPTKVDGIHRTILLDAFQDVNWIQLAEDMAGP